MTLHVALTGAYPTEATARTGITENMIVPEPLPTYRGIWRMPMGAIVHLFTDEDTEVLNAAGMALVSSALPGDRPWTGEGS